MALQVNAYKSALINGQINIKNQPISLLQILPASTEDSLKTQRTLLKTMQNISAI